jgi:NAD(P)-dependent dehydrogenase (short-subunit alcohol dehydrogenase family)
MTTKSKQLLITGVSSGLGRAFALEAVRVGHRVVGTVRTPEAAAAFEAGGDVRATAILLDVTDEQAVLAAIAQVEQNQGPIDVLIASAGYGHEGLFEESTMADLRRQFEVNVFGTVAVIRAVLPGMRQRRSGHILAVTSIGGLTTSPGLSFYHGSKYAMEGILESLGKEMAPLGIYVTAIEPGPFRTDWSGRSMVHSSRTIHDYDEFYEPIREARARYDGQQPGDPEKAGAAVLIVIDAGDPPKHLLLGADAMTALAASREAFDRDAARWESVTRSTDFTSR